MKPTVLVTGVGAIIGYGVLRSLRGSGKVARLVGADIYDDAVGRAWADDFVQAPLTSSPEYPHWLKSTLAVFSIDLLIPGIEQDVQFFTEHRSLFHAAGIKVVLNSHDLIRLSTDKWLLFKELSSIKSPAAITSRTRGSYASLAKALGVPFILKPRKGSASKGLLRVFEEEDFAPFAAKLGHEYIAQPFIGTDDEEYTVGVFGDGLGGVNAFIAFRRTLGPGGATNKACTIEDEGLYSATASLCRHFKPLGPTNFQFRKYRDGWKLLEINPRISSSTSIRTAFGYNEAAMCVDYFLHNTTICQPKLKKGRAIRYIEDYIRYDSNTV